jgi:ribosomal protein S18 acetylase RimI-like enzyme
VGVDVGRRRVNRSWYVGPVIRLVPMTEPELTSRLSQMWVAYAESLLDAGFTSDEAAANVERNRRSLFTDGHPNADQYLFDVFDDGTRIGALWLAEETAAGRGGWYIYDVEIDEEYRGRGLGRATMRAAEDFARDHGGVRLGLNVFGPNEVARRLYESMDYRITAIGMRKDLA